MLQPSPERAEGDVIAGVLGHDKVRLAEARAVLAAPADHLEEEIISACRLIEAQGGSEESFAREYRLLVSKGNAEPTDADLDAANEAARRDFAKVKTSLPIDRDAHPMSGRCGEY